MVLSTAHFCLTFCFGVKFDMIFFWACLAYFCSFRTIHSSPLCSCTLCAFRRPSETYSVCFTIPQGLSTSRGTSLVGFATFTSFRPSFLLVFFSHCRVTCRRTLHRAGGRNVGRSKLLLHRNFTIAFFLKYLLFFIHFFIRSIVLFCFTRCCTVDRITKTNLYHCFILYYFIYSIYVMYKIKCLGLMYETLGAHIVEILGK